MLRIESDFVDGKYVGEVKFGSKTLYMSDPCDSLADAMWAAEDGFGNAIARLINVNDVRPKKAKGGGKK